MSAVHSGVVLAGGAERPVLIPAAYDIIWSSVIFVILFFLFWRLVLPKYLRVLDERTERIQGGLDKAEAAQAEADAKLKEYNDQLAEARDEAGRIREQARGEGAAIIAEMRERAQSEANRVTELAKRQLQAERQQALTQLHREVGRLAVDLAGRVVGESLSDDDRQRRVVDRFLVDLERSDAERAAAAERAEADRQAAARAAEYAASGRTGSTALGGGGA